MKVLVAPDKFKGSLTAHEVCEAIKSAILETGSHDVMVIPLADGGEGTCDLMTRISQGKFVATKAYDPLMREINSGYGISEDRSTAFIEMALASGLQLLKADERNCSITTSFGTGQLIKHALESGAKEIVIGIGGSATNDAGIGMAQALGFKFLDKEGRELDGTGSSLIKINSIDISEVHPKIKDARFTVLCDVDNPLFGPSGAAHVFAKQKGASAEDIKMLDRGLHKFSDLALSMNCVTDFPGAGAAGGLGAGSKLFLNADIRKGIDFIIEYTGLENKIKEADLIITGEGKLDEQTLSGKVVSGVAALAQKHHKPLVAITGSCELRKDQLEKTGISRVLSLASESISTSEAMQNAVELISLRIKEAALFSG